MFVAPNVAYRFGQYLLVPGEKRLSRATTPVPLPPKAFDALILLVERAGHLVEKQEFFSRLWPETFVQEDALAQIISLLRRKLSDGNSLQEFIQTIPKRGYRFVLSVERIPSQRAALIESGEERTSNAELQRVTVAVLPFRIFGGNAELEYMAGGLLDEVIVSLGQIDPDRLGVIGHTSVMKYKSGSKSLAEIGRETGAAFVVESSLREDRGHLRILSKLIHALSQEQIWADSYDAKPANMLEFQHDLSLAIARQIRIQLSSDRLKTLERRHTRQLEAYDFYLRGRHFWNQHSPPAVARAIEYYLRAVELDPQYALAWSGLADCHSSRPINSDAPPALEQPRARRAAEQAIAANPNLAETQTSLGLEKFWFEWDWTAAEQAFRKAVELDSSYSLGHRYLGVVLSHSGRHEEANSVLSEVRELDPLLPMNHAISSQAAFSACDFAQAEQFARHATALDPDFWIGYQQLAQACEQLGHHEEALHAFNAAARLSGGNSKPLSCRGYLLGRLNRVREAQEVLGSFERISRERYLPPYATALVHAGLENERVALDWLERAFEVRDIHLVFLPTDAKWDRLRTHPRFDAIMGRCGFRDFASPQKGH